MDQQRNRAGRAETRTHGQAGITAIKFGDATLQLSHPRIETVNGTAPGPATGMPRPARQDDHFG